MKFRPSNGKISTKRHLLKPFECCSRGNLSKKLINSWWKNSTAQNYSILINKSKIIWRCWMTYAGNSWLSSMTKILWLKLLKKDQLCFLTSKWVMRQTSEKSKMIWNTIHQKWEVIWSEVSSIQCKLRTQTLSNLQILSPKRSIYK